MIRLRDLETILVPLEIKLYILGEHGYKYFFFDRETGEFKQKNSKLDMFDLYRDYQLDYIQENSENMNCIEIHIRWRKDLWGDDPNKK